MAQNHCSDSLSLVVIADTLKPQINLVQANPLLCGLSNVVINNGNGTSYDTLSFDWNTQNGNIVSIDQNGNATVNKIGNYTLLTTHKFNGCTAMDSIKIDEDTTGLRSFELNLTDPLCFSDKNGSISIINPLGNYPPYAISLNGGPFMPSLEFYDLSAGEYSIIVRDSVGCEKDSMIVLNDGYFFDVFLPNDTILRLGEQLSIPFKTLPVTTGGWKIIWKVDGQEVCPDCITLNLQPESTITVGVEVVDSNGCFNDDQMVIIVNNAVVIDSAQCHLFKWQ